jgi:hypothetical protein
MNHPPASRDSLAREIAALQRRLSVAIGAAAADAHVNLAGFDASVSRLCRAAETLPEADRPAVADGLERLLAGLAWLARAMPREGGGEIRPLR